MSRLIAAVAILALILLYFSGLTSFGLIGPDEPRYSSIGRDMARSNDWVTPRLWGSAWFEKPPLLYWMIGGAFRTGLADDAAPRVPIALCAFTFLLFYFIRLRYEFGLFVGATAVGLLATSALWIAFSHAAVTDLPMAATFAAALFLLLPLADGRPAHVSLAAALLGLSVLAKGLVPLVLILPFFWFARHAWRKWLHPLPLAVFAVVALPWYIACYARNGRGLIDVLFLQHTFGRFTSDAMQHVQPFWFYVPVLLGALFPSTLLCLFAFRRGMYRDRRLQWIAATFVFGFLFFSAARNKLPGYILPLLPLVCALAAAGIDAELRESRKPLALALSISAMLLPIFAIIAGLLPRALLGGWRGSLPDDLITVGRMAAFVPLAIVAAGVLIFLKREHALALWFTVAAAGWVYVEYAALPWVDRTSSARALWRQLPKPKDAWCVGEVNRNWRYGLNYYSIAPLHDCSPGRNTHAIVPGPSPAARPVLEGEL